MTAVAIACGILIAAAVIAVALVLLTLACTVLEAAWYVARAILRGRWD